MNFQLSSTVNLSSKHNLKTIRAQLKTKLFSNDNRTTLSLQNNQNLQTKKQSTPDNSSSDKNSNFSSKKSRSSLQLIAEYAQPEAFDDEWTVQNYIGQGAHAVIKQCRPKIQNSKYDDHDGKRQYAVKIFRAGDPEIMNTIKKTFNNNRYLQECDLICKAYELYIDECTESAHLVMEYFDYPSLESVLQRKKISVTLQKNIIRELARALEFMHSRGIAHRDLKPDNILIKIQEDKQKQTIKSNRLLDIKIIDFGVSKRFLQKSRNSQVNITRDMWTRTGTIFYQAPEMFQAVCYDKQIDIWSLGVILFQIFCKKLPFQSETIMDTIQLISEETDSFEKHQEFKELDSLQQDIIKRLLKKDPSKRLSAEGLLQFITYIPITLEIILHPWLAQKHTSETQHQQSTQDDAYIQLRVGQYLILFQYFNLFKDSGDLYSPMNQSSYLDINLFRATLATPLKLENNYFNYEDSTELNSPQKLNNKQVDWKFNSHIHYVKKEEYNTFTVFNNLQQVEENENENLNENGNESNMKNPFKKSIEIFNL